MPWHDSWRSMRKIAGPRDWFTLEELQEHLVAAGRFRIGEHALRRAIAAAGIDPPECLYGLNRYLPAHVEAAAAYASAAEPALAEKI